MSDPAEFAPPADALPAVRAPDVGTSQGGSGDDERRKRIFAYDETKRVLDRQSTVLSELRNRANIMLTANAVVATLFASSVLGKDHALALEILALAAFALGIAACVAVLWPVHDYEAPGHPRQWQVTFNLQELVTFIEGTDSAEWREWTAPNPKPGKFQRARNLNWRTNKKRTRYLEAAGVLLVIQVGLWAAVVLA